MAMSTPKKIVLGSAGAALLGIGIAVPAIASAADPSTPSASTSAAPGTPGADRRAEHQQELAEALAAELGLPVDKVKAALESAQQKMATTHRAEHRTDLKTRLDAAVTAGKLTQAQADAILAAYDAGVVPGGGPGGPGGHGPGFGGPGR